MWRARLAEMNIVDPAASTSPHPSIAAFGGFLLAHRDEITRQWVTAVDRSPEVESSEDLTYRHLLDHLPQLCEELAAMLTDPPADGVDDGTARYSRTHGKKRWQQGYKLEEVIREVCIIRDDFLGRWIEAYEDEFGRMEVDARRSSQRIVRRFFDNVIVGSAVQYVEEQQSLLGATEAALVEQTDRAEIAGSARKKFLGLVSHELRTPLTPILMGASVLLSDESMPLKARALAAVISHNARLEASFIDDLLDACRLTRNQLTLTLAETDVRVCLSRAVDCCSGEFDAKKLVLDLHVGPTAPFLLADESRLQRAFATLLRNAANVSREGGSVVVRMHDAAGALQVSVADSGGDINDETIRNAFVPFEEERRLPFALEGLGVSRYVAKAIFEAHGGTISVQPAEHGGGAIFIVRLPQAATA
jgi:signal transduction histidine kinase